MYDIPYIVFSYVPTNLQLPSTIPLSASNDILPTFVPLCFGLLTGLLVFDHLKQRINTTYTLFGVILCDLTMGTHHDGLITVLPLALFVSFLCSKHAQDTRPHFFRSTTRGIFSSRHVRCIAREGMLHLSEGKRGYSSLLPACSLPLPFSPERYIKSHLPEQARVLFIYVGHRGHYGDRDDARDMSTYRGSASRQLVEESDHPQTVLLGIENTGLTHLLLNDGMCDEWVQSHFAPSGQQVRNLLQRGRRLFLHSTGEVRCEEVEKNFFVCSRPGNCTVSGPEAGAADCSFRKPDRVDLTPIRSHLAGPVLPV